MGLAVYNTLTRTKEAFVPLHEGRVGMYVCGPTVYGHSHLGHAKSYVSFDVVVRYLRYRGYTVLYVQNITDVGHLTDDADQGEDKIVRQSRIDRVHPMQLTETFTRSYFEDMDALGVQRPDISPRATGHITEQIALIQRLVESGMAYEANGSVYFDVRAFPGYGRLSGRAVDDLAAGVRVEVKAEKRHPADFALWKKADPGHIMRWPSPWGEGYPGWHVECSAMAMKYLGESIDIHGGGLENQFPHHECEIAQSEGSSGRPFVKYWLHNNMVRVDGRKMGKSLGNFVTLKEAFARWRPRVVRFFILQSHYRSTLDFSAPAVEAAGKGLERLDQTVAQVHECVNRADPTGPLLPLELGRFREAFLSAMDDDFNTPQAIAVLFDLSRQLQPLLAPGQHFAAPSLEAVAEFYRTCAGDILGIAPVAAEAATAGTGSDIVPALMGVLVSLRDELRSQKLWQLADRLRGDLAALGIAVEDGKGGTTWKRTGTPHPDLSSPAAAPSSAPASEAPPPAASPGKPTIKPELSKDVRRVFGDDDL